MMSLRLLVVTFFLIGACTGTILSPHQFATSRLPEDGYYPNLGNGNIAFDVGRPTSDTSSSAGYVFAAGTYSGYGSTSPSKRARIPQIETIYAGDAYLNEKKCVHSWVADLDIEKAVFTNTSTYNCFNETRCILRISSLVHATEVGLILYHISTSPLCRYTIKSCPVTSSPEVKEIKRVVERNITSVLYQTVEPEVPGSDLATVAIASERAPSSITSSSDITLRTLVYSSVWSSPSFNLTCPFSAPANWSLLLDMHTFTWTNRWASGIEIHGNDTVAAAVNASMYYILSSVSADEAWSVSPGGLPKNSYNGHVFWDCETWMLPALAPFYPNITSSFIRYRFERLQAAVMRAEKRGYGGAMMPWESAYTGVDVTPTGNIEGDYEIHVTADIPLALKSLYEWSGDENWLLSNWKLVSDCCLYLADRVTCDDVKCTYLNVQPPDEQAGIVNSSVYTNAAAKVLLSWAADTGRKLHVISQQIAEEWQYIANNMYIPLDSSLTGTPIHAEYEGYAGEYINQADAVLLQFPLMLPMSAQVKYSDLIYYESRTSVPGETRGFYTGDSSYSIGYLNLLRQGFQPPDEADLRNLAANQFLAAFDHIDFSAFLIWRETLDGGHYNFITGAGGFLQNVIYGYAGLVITENALFIEPVLPPCNVTMVTLKRLRYCNNTLTVTYNATTIDIRLDYGAILAVFDNGMEYRLNSGDMVSASAGKAVINDIFE